jgi:hypothetical protein
MSRSSRAKPPLVRASCSPAKIKSCLKIAGSRIGTKHRDMRWKSPDGEVWASRFEYSVFFTLKEKGFNVRRTNAEQDRMAYTAPVRNGVCEACASTAVVTNHFYTPDLFVSQGDQSGGPAGYYIEAKGYLRAPQRSLIRAFRKARPDVDLRFVVQSDYKVGKSTVSGWITRYLRSKVHVWNGNLPGSWSD